MSGLEPAMLASIAAATGTIVSAAGQYRQGQAQESYAKLQSDLEKRRANEEEAVSQRRAEVQRRATEKALSRIRAVSAASGAGADDPTVEDIEDKVAAEGEFNALSELYSGRSSAQGLRLQSQATRAQGINAARQSRFAVAGTLLEGATSLYDRYGRRRERLGEG